MAGFYRSKYTVDGEERYEPSAMALHYAWRQGEGRGGKRQKREQGEGKWEEEIMTDEE